MFDDFPEYNFVSVNGNYMNSGSVYAPNVQQIQENTTLYYSEDSRTDEIYPPIGQLVPIGDDFILIVYIVIYAIIKLFLKKHLPYFGI